PGARPELAAREGRRQAVGRELSGELRRLRRLHAEDGHHQAAGDRPGAGDQRPDRRHQPLRPGEDRRRGPRLQGRRLGREPTAFGGPTRGVGGCMSAESAGHESRAADAAQRVLEATELIDLHIHVGAAVAPHVLWEIAHDHGFKLPVRTYPEFQDLIYADPNRVTSLDGYLDIMHRWTERIQSSPSAIERSVYSIIGKEHRSSRVSTIELRFNPMKRNLGGERDLDHIIAAAIRGMDRACLAYGIRAGLIFCLAREFDYELNDIIVRKAERYRDR